jgi:hypothetical protein
VKISPLQAEALAQTARRPPSNASVEIRRQRAAVAQLVSPDLVHPADFACRAREYEARQRKQRDPLIRAEIKEPLYIPLELCFRRALGNTWGLRGSLLGFITV